MNHGFLHLSPFPRGGSTETARRGQRPSEEVLARVRGLVETTTLSLREIARRTGVSAPAISRHAAARGWRRPEAAFVEERLTPEGRRCERRGALAGRILRRAEELVSIVEMDPGATVAQMARAARLLRLAESLDTGTLQRRRGRRKPSKRPNQSPSSDQHAT